MLLLFKNVLYKCQVYMVCVVMSQQLIYLRFLSVNVTVRITCEVTVVVQDAISIRC